MAFQPSEMTQDTLRRLVDNLTKHLKKHPLTHPSKRSAVQEAMASALGWPSYHAAITALKKNSMTVAPAAGTPSKGKSLAGVW